MDDCLERWCCHCPAASSGPRVPPHPRLEASVVICNSTGLRTTGEWFQSLTYCSNHSSYLTVSVSKDNIISHVTQWLNTRRYEAWMISLPGSINFVLAIHYAVTLAKHSCGDKVPCQYHTNRTFEFLFVIGGNWYFWVPLWSHIFYSVPIILGMMADLTKFIFHHNLVFESPGLRDQCRRRVCRYRMKWSTNTEIHIFRDYDTGGQLDQRRLGANRCIRRCSPCHGNNNHNPS